MSSLIRKIKRKKKKELEKELSDKVAGILNIPDQCTACDAPFDKTNREMVETWRVIVRRQKGKTRLYCPPCWDIGQEMLKEIMKGEKDVEQ